MDDWTKEQADFLVKIGQLPPAAPAPKTTIKKDEEQTISVFLNNKVGVKINSVDLSDHATAVTINRTFDELEVTAMGDSGHKFVKGLEASSVTIDFMNDTATASVLPTLQAAWGTNVTVVFLQDKSAAVSATNPLYTMTCLINNTTDINGAVADLAMQSLTFNVSGTIAVATTGTF